MASIVKSDAAHQRPAGQVSQNESEAADESAVPTDTSSPIHSDQLAGGGVVGRVPGGVTGLASFNLDDLAQTSLEQLERCRQHIRGMLADAERNAAQISDEARKDGYNKGAAQAKEDFERRVATAAEAKAQSQLASLTQAVEKMHAEYDAWMQSYADALTDMVIAATRRLVQGRLSADVKSLENETAKGSEFPNMEPLVATWAREALHSTRSASRLILAVHPETLAEIGEALDGLLAHPGLPESSAVVPDPTVDLGDVVVRQDGGEIRSGLNSQLERLRETWT